MKHISEYLIPKMRQLEQTRQLRLFEISSEKGSREWSAFNSVRGDVVNSYSVRAPKKAIVIAQEHHVLRIVYPPMHTLRRA